MYDFQVRLSCGMMARQGEALPQIRVFPDMSSSQNRSLSLSESSGKTHRRKYRRKGEILNRDRNFERVGKVIGLLHRKERALAIA